MATQQERREMTRTGLLATARNLLIKEGIKGTTTRAILDTAQVSRGAMYHHFPSLEDLIAEIFSQESKGAILRALKNRNKSANPIEDLTNTCLAWLDEIVDEDVAKILVIEGPAAIGWRRCREIEEKHSLDQLKTWLQAASARGDINIPSVALMATMINALLTEAAIAIVSSDNRERTRDQAGVLFQKMMHGIKAAS